MTKAEEARIREVINRYCDQNGGGAREIYLLPNEFRGVNFTLVWDKFESIELGRARLDGILNALRTEMGQSVFQIIRTIKLYSFSEKAAKEALVGVIADEPEWLRAH